MHIIGSLALFTRRTSNVCPLFAVQLKLDVCLASVTNLNIGRFFKARQLVHASPAFIQEQTRSVLKLLPVHEQHGVIMSFNFAAILVNGRELVLTQQKKTQIIF